MHVRRAVCLELQRQRVRVQREAPVPHQPAHKHNKYTCQHMSNIQNRTRTDLILSNHGSGVKLLFGAEGGRRRSTAMDADVTSGSSAGPYVITSANTKSYMMP